MAREIYKKIVDLVIQAATLVRSVWPKRSSNDTFHVGFSEGRIKDNGEIVYEDDTSGSSWLRYQPLIHGLVRPYKPEAPHLRRIMKRQGMQL